MAKKKKARVIRMRFRKNDPAHNLLAAVQHWVIANGGNLVVIGGIETQHMPFEEFKFKVAVGCLGKIPPKAVAKS